MVFFLISGLITVVRIALRVQKRMFWWDDFWALVSLACFTTFVPGMLNFLLSPFRIILTSLKVFLSSPTVPLTRCEHVSPVIIWVSWNILRLVSLPTHPPITVGGFYYCTVWAARLSIIFTVVRIAPWGSQKRVMLVVALVMFFQWVLLMVQMFWVCEKGDTAWKEALFALCPLGLHVAITQAVSEYSLSHSSS